jgi:hypothetical protein
MDKTSVEQPTLVESSTSVTVTETIKVQAVAEAQQNIPYDQPMSDYDQKREDMACSLDNPDACEACGS